MPRTQYRNSSPYADTNQTSLYLDVYTDRDLFPDDTDDDYIIETQYEFRPDLLSFDLYGSSDFWWIFIRRNMDIMTDPIYDFKAGLEIKIPPRSFIENMR